MSDPKVSRPVLREGKYRHYKGNDYEVLHLARDSETETWCVVYRCLYGDFSLWVRPYEDFVAEVKSDSGACRRFEYVA